MNPQASGAISTPRDDDDWTRINPHDGTLLPYNVMAYKARSGKIQLKPSLDLVQELDDEGCGFCLACGSTSTPAEPDAGGYTCDVCAEPKVYGAAELALRGLVF
jgi:hypothetical protein